MSFLVSFTPRATSYLFLFEGILSPDDPDEEHDEGDCEEDVNEGADGVSRDYAEKPEYEKYCRDGCDHVIDVLSLVVTHLRSWSFHIMILLSVAYGD